MRTFSNFPLPLRFALRELRGGVKGFKVFLACLILGVGAIAAVGGLTDSIRTSLTEQGQSLLGGDIELRLFQREASDAELAFFSEGAEVSKSIRLRGVIRSPATDKRTLVELKGVDDLYPLYGQLVLDPPVDRALAFAFDGTHYGIAIDPFLADRLEIGVGDTVELGTLTFEVRSLIETEPDRSNEGFLWGPTVIVSTDVVFETGLISPGSLYNSHYKIRLPEEVDVLAWQDSLAEAFPEATWRVRDRDGGAPGVRRFVDNMGMFLTLISLTALLVGGVGVGNAVGNYMRGKTKVIATMKILGADSSLVFKTYLVQIGIFSLVAVLAGLLVGVLAAFTIVGLIGSALPVEVGFTLSASPLILAAVYGIFVSIIFSIWPLAVAKKVSPVQMMRDLVAHEKVRPEWKYIFLMLLLVALVMGLALYLSPWKYTATGFVVGAAAIILMLRQTGKGVAWLFSKAPRSKKPALRLAIANLHRPGAATGAVVMSLGLGLSLFAMVALIDKNFSANLNEQIPDEAPAFFMLDIQRAQADDFKTLAEGLDGVTDLNLVASLRGRLTEFNGVPVDEVELPNQDSAWVIGGDRTISYFDALPENNTLTEGVWWDEDYSGPPLVSFAAEEARNLGLAIGDFITINVMGQEINAEISSLRSFDWGTRNFNFVMIFTPKALQGAPHTFMASLDAELEQESAIHKAITDAFPNVTAIRIREILTSIDNILIQIRSAVNYTGSLAILAGILVLGGALAAGYRARVYDSVILKILGAVRRNVMTAFIFEYLLLGIITGVLALGFGGVASYLIMTEVMDMTFVFYPGAAGLTIVVSLVITLFFGIINTWQALGEKPTTVLRQF
jgi:putative ABC transport system permease protein